MLIKPFMPQFAVTYMAKNPLTEAVHLSNKSSDFISFYMQYPVFLMEKLIDIMEDDDDVQNIWHNWEE